MNDNYKNLAIKIPKEVYGKACEEELIERNIKRIEDTFDLNYEKNGRQEGTYNTPNNNSAVKFEERNDGSLVMKMIYKENSDIEEKLMDGKEVDYELKRNGFFSPEDGFELIKDSPIKNMSIFQYLDSIEKEYEVIAEGLRGSEEVESLDSEISDEWLRSFPEIPDFLEE